MMHLIRLFPLLIWSFLYSEELNVFAAGEYTMQINEEFKSLNAPVSANNIYSKHKDFIKKVDLQESSYFISPYLSIPSNFRAHVKLKATPEKKEKFFVVSSQREKTIEDLQNYKLGTFNLMGKLPTKAFIKNVLRLNLGKLKLANHLKDLQILLGLEVVDVLLLNQTQLQNILSKTDQDLTILWESPDSYDFSYCLFTKQKNLDPKLINSINSVSIPSLSITKWKRF